MTNRLFKIPRNAPVTTKPYWDLVRKHGRSYKSMVAFICNIGGYASHGDRFAVEFNVKDHYSNCDVDNLWKVAIERTDFAAHFEALPFVQKHFMEQSFRTEYAEHADNVHAWGLEETRESWEDSDCPYETWIGERIDWEWEFAGRGGGHLCIKECAGISLESTDEDLYERLMEKTDGAYGYSVDDVRRLFILCVGLTVELQGRKVSEEVEYRAAWRIYSMAESTFDEVVKYHEERDELREHAYNIANAISCSSDETQDAFKRICKLAGVTLES